MELYYVNRKMLTGSTERFSVVFLLILCIIKETNGGIYHCPEGDPCTACSKDCDYICVTVPTGNHDPDIADEVELINAGYKGFTHNTTLQYRVVFHNNTLDYPCSTWCSNQNKLFGISRGLTSTTTRSCMITWRKTINDEPVNQLSISGYGWYNRTDKPWETPGQNPFLIFAEAQKEYIFSIIGNDTSCYYSVLDGDTLELLAEGTTPEEEPLPGPNYKFVLYFGGEENATQPTTVSYSSNLFCDSSLKHFGVGNRIPGL